MGQRGFTLIELLVVIAIIGILAAAAIPQITGAICDANASSGKSAIASIRTAYSQCKVDGKNNCGTLSSGNYSEYLSSDVISRGTIGNVGGQLNTVEITGIGCQWNGDIGQSASNTLIWQSANGKIVPN